MCTANLSRVSGELRPDPDPTVGDWEGEDIHFGEQGAKLTYGSYLQLPKLLDAQHGRRNSGPGTDRA